jgi:hypothetical protein
VPYEELAHAVVYTAQEVAPREHVNGHRVAKVVIAQAIGCPVELVSRASRRAVLKRVQDAREIRLATKVEIER